MFRNLTGWSSRIAMYPSTDGSRQNEKGFVFLHHTINQNFADICNEIRKEFGRAEQAWVARGNTASGIAKYWDVWIRDHQKNIVTKPLRYIDIQGAELEAYWNDKLASSDECESKEADRVFALLSTLQR